MVGSLGAVEDGEDPESEWGYPPQGTVWWQSEYTGDGLVSRACLCQGAGSPLAWLSRHSPPPSELGSAAIGLTAWAWAWVLLRGAGEHPCAAVSIRVRRWARHAAGTGWLPGRCRRSGSSGSQTHLASPARPRDCPGAEVGGLRGACGHGRATAQPGLADTEAPCWHHGRQRLSEAFPASAEVCAGLWIWVDAFSSLSLL